MKLADLEIKTFVNSDFGENLYVLRLKESAECVIVDPGMEPEKAIDYINSANLVPRAILITHGHYDHIGGLNRVKAEWPNAEILIGELERWKMAQPEGNLSVHFGAQLRTVDADRSLADGETFTARRRNRRFRRRRDLRREHRPDRFPRRRHPGASRLD